MDSSGGTFTRSKTDSFYDAEGNRIAVEQSVLKADGSRDTETDIQSRHFDYSANGNLVQKQSGTQTQSMSQVSAPSTAALGYKASEYSPSHYLYANNQYLGELDERGRVNVKRQHFDGVDPNSAGANQRYTVQPGQTLRQIATLFYGNADYWYILADVNGLTQSSDEVLNEGLLLDIPERQNSANRFDVFTPDNVSQRIGSTTPGLPYVPPPAEQGCNVIATLIVAVVSTVVTAGVASAASGFTGGLIAGASGSVAGQLAGITLGVQDGFSLKQVGVSALTAGVVRGLGDKLVAGDTFGQVGTTGRELSAAGRAVVGAAGAVANAAANKLVGNPSGFSWANVAGRAVASSLGSRLPGEGATGGDIFLTAIQAVGAEVAGHVTQKALGGKGKFNLGTVAANAFGNALGNSIVSQSQQSHADKVAEQERMLAAIGAIGRDAVDANLNSRLENATATSLAKAQQQGAANLSAKVAQQQAQSDVAFEAEQVAAQNDSSQRASDYVAQSETYFYQGNVLAIQSLQARQSAAERIQQSFDTGVAEGEYNYLAGVGNRLVSGLSSTNIAASVYAQSRYERNIWADGIARGQALRIGIGDFITSAAKAWTAFESNNPLASQIVGRDSIVTTIGGVIDDATSALAGALVQGGKVSQSYFLDVLPGNNRVMTPINPNPSFTVPALGQPQLANFSPTPSGALNVAKVTGVLAEGAKSGGILSAILAPVGTVIEFSVEGKSLNTAEFANEVLYDTSKGILTGAAAGYVGAGVAALVAAAGAPVLAVGGLAIVAGIGVGALAGYGIDSVRGGVNYIFNDWLD